MNTSRKKNGGKKRSIGMYTDRRGRKRPVTPRVATVTIIIPGHDAVRHEKEWETEGHWELKNGERIWIPEHENHTHFNIIEYKRMLYRGQERYLTNKKDGIFGIITDLKNGRYEYAVVNHGPHVLKTKGVLAASGHTNNLEDAKREVDSKLKQFWGPVGYQVKKHTVKRQVIRYAGGFKTLAKKITEEYKKKGLPTKEAEKFGVETAADVYRDKMATDFER